MKNILSFVFFFFCFAACKTPSFIEKKMVAFDTGFSTKYQAYGTWYDKNTQKEYIYFGNDIINDPIIRFFTLDGQRQSDIEDIPLRSRNGIRGLAEITSIFVYDIDTIVIIDYHEYTNQMVYLNRKGERIQKVNFFDSLSKADTERYQIISCVNNVSDKPFVYLRCSWNWTNPKDSNLLPSSFKNKLEHHKVYYKEFYKTPAVCKWNLRTNTSTFTEPNIIPNYFIPQRDTSVVLDADSLVLSESLRSCYDNKLFLWMRTSNRILVLNPDNLRIEHSFDITSKYSPIGISPFPLRLRNQILQKNEFIGGHINKILYDRKRNLYYIVTNHEIPEDDAVFFSETPFSIHIYDAKFNKLNEQYFEGEKYSYYYIFLTSQGLFIAQNDNNKDYDPTKCKFFFFELEQ